MAILQPVRASTYSDGHFNASMAVLFREAADVLEAQDAEPHRVAAYRRGAAALERLLVPASTIYRHDGLAGLISLEAIGEVMAHAIADVVETGHWEWLERLERHAGPDVVFTLVPGIGHGLAHRLHSELALDTIDDLERAFYDGRVGRMRGFGDKRMHTVRAALIDRRRPHTEVRTLSAERLTTSSGCRDHGHRAPSVMQHFGRHRAE